MGGQAGRAADLGDRVNGHPEAVEAVLPELEAIVRSPDDIQALVSAIQALSHAWDSRAAGILLDHVNPHHVDALVRTALVQSLPGGASEEPERSRAIGVLTDLSADESAEVRDWACFGLGQLSADTPAARDALAVRLNDDDSETRGEALVALANLADPRALPSCLGSLAVQPDEIGLMTLKAATALGHPSLLPALRRLEKAWEHDPTDEHTTALTDAISRCTANAT